MQNFETTPAKRALHRSTLAGVPYPVQVAWGHRDSAIRVDTYGEAAQRAARVDTVHRLPGKHFLQEDHADAIADLIGTFVRS